MGKRGSKQRVRTYTDGDIATGLHAYVWAGSALAAERETGLPNQRIGEWAKLYPERVEAEREKMREAYREKLYATRQAYLQHLADHVADANVAQATGALKELSRCIDNIEGNPTSRVAFSIENELARIRKERGLSIDDEGDDDGPGETV